MERKIQIAYDKDADVVHITFANVKAEAEEIDDGIFARYDPKTKELVGFTITNFSRKFAQNQGNNHTHKQSIEKSKPNVYRSLFRSAWLRFPYHSAE